MSRSERKVTGAKQRRKRTAAAAVLFPTFNSVIRGKKKILPNDYFAARDLSRGQRLLSGLAGIVRCARSLARGHASVTAGG